MSGHTRFAATRFGPADRRRLESALSAAREARLRRRLEAVLLVAEGQTVSEVARRVRAARLSVRRWVERHLAGHDAAALADRPVAGDRARRHGSPRAAWLPPWPATHVAVDTGPPPGRCRCWDATCAGAMASRSAPAPCVGACTRRDTAGSGRATSMRGGRRTWPRKRGIDPAAAGRLARRRRAAVRRLDTAAAVSAAARGLGAPGHAGDGAGHGRERQAGAVRRHRPADRA